MGTVPIVTFLYLKNIDYTVPLGTVISIIKLIKSRPYS